MNGPSHYAEAERLLAEAADARDDGRGQTMRYCLDTAQIHATLALAAATAANIRRNGAVPTDGDAWTEVMR